jgi:adenine-specific DNA-methyltransferase
MATVKELQDQLKLLRAENKALKNSKDTSFFSRMLEQSESANKLRQNNVPYFVEERSRCVYKDNQPVTTLIEGDNLSVLVGLTYKYENKVDFIYIDPPYNTGKNVYTYSDNYNYSGVKRTNSLKEDSHSSWLSFMEPRLVLAKELLQETGIIMVAVGTREQAHLKLLMDNVFGEDNLIAILSSEGMLKNNASYVSVSNEYSLIYAKDVQALKKNNVKWRSIKPSGKLLLKKAKEAWEEANYDANKASLLLRKFYRSNEAKEIFNSEPGLKMYNNIDETGRVYRAGDLSSPSNKGGRYSVIDPNTGKEVTIPKRGWVHSEKTFSNMIESNLILWNKDNGVPSYKRYLDENLEIVLSDVIRRDRDAPNRLLQKIIGRDKFTFPKDHFLLSEWIEYVIPDYRKRDIENPPLILDFFAGSGTTAHAVAYLNAQNASKFECILVTNNENEIPYKVTQPRLKALFTGKWATEEREPLPGQLIFLKTKYSTAQVEPKTIWNFIPYSPAYIAHVRNKIHNLKTKFYL